VFDRSRFRSRFPLLSTAASDGHRAANVAFQLGLCACGVLIAETGWLLHARILQALEEDTDQAEEIPAQGLLVAASFINHALIFPLLGLLVALVGLVNYDENEAWAHAALTSCGVCVAFVAGTVSAVLAAVAIGPGLLWLKIVSLSLVYCCSCAFFGLYSKAHENVPPEHIGRGERAFEVFVEVVEGGEDTHDEDDADGGEHKASPPELEIRIPASLTGAAFAEYAAVSAFGVFILSIAADLG
jgi:hypothetical protein